VEGLGNRQDQVEGLGDPQAIHRVDRLEEGPDLAQSHVGAGIPASGGHQDLVLALDQVGKVVGEAHVKEVAEVGVLDVADLLDRMLGQGHAAQLVPDGHPGLQFHLGLDRMMKAVVDSSRPPS
jgi:hypothetical protein